MPMSSYYERMKAARATHGMIAFCNRDTAMKIAREADAEIEGLREHLNNMLREYDTQEAQFGDDYCWTKWADVEAVAAARAALGEGER